MKKFSRFIAIALLLCFALSISAAAWYSGVRDQQTIHIPRINPDNPRIPFDGTVDLDGAWAGAAHFTFDITTLNTELTVWDWSVWQGTVPYVEHWDDIPPEQRHRWDYYLLWDDRGLYIAIICETDRTAIGLDAAGMAAIAGGTADPEIVPDRHSFMIVPYDNLDGGNAAPNMYWWYFYPEAENDFWHESRTLMRNSFDNPENFPVRVGSTRATAPNAQGAYPYRMEIFIPWNTLQYWEGQRVREVNPVEGWTFMMGTIAEDRTGDLYTQIRVTNSEGWLNYDYFVLAGPVAAVAAAAVEVAEEAPAAEAPAVPAPVTAAPAPQTSDMTIILMFLAVAAAAVFAKVKVRNR